MLRFHIVFLSLFVVLPPDLPPPLFVTFVPPAPPLPICVFLNLSFLPCVCVLSFWYFNLLMHVFVDLAWPRLRFCGGLDVIVEVEHT